MPGCFGHPGSVYRLMLEVRTNGMSAESGIPLLCNAVQQFNYQIQKIDCSMKSYPYCSLHGNIGVGG